MKYLVSIALITAGFALSGCDNNDDKEAVKETKKEVSMEATKPASKEVAERSEEPRVKREPKPENSMTAAERLKRMNSGAPVKESRGSSKEEINLWKKQWEETSAKMAIEANMPDEPEIIIIKSEPKSDSSATAE